MIILIYIRLKGMNFFYFLLVPPSFCLWPSPTICLSYSTSLQPWILFLLVYSADSFHTLLIYSLRSSMWKWTYLLDLNLLFCQELHVSFHVFFWATLLNSFSVYATFLSEYVPNWSGSIIEGWSDNNWFNFVGFYLF